ncbi:arylesterase [Parvibaculum sp.]|jgi:acyl-CoA thioesterase-1|uniref:arylesterase n=1 Tax=Parvibaculum sp. TaxID=2024848 RepID=UPI001B14DBEF|nr:arylesterase [Parvibaculum sp.]MBO6633678.1 arylesterase [Parvibaculum sp.]MBO6677307.1 arylesterase [Parvibaculum sp.]MBO6684963.1 arylesterase [Parvibaculum sp.]MBO6905327.1 arylesterase [Parvibaculum sp.]
MRYGLWGPLCKLFGGGALVLILLAAPLSAQAEDGELTIVALGDSLTAGYLLGPDEGFVEQLDRALDAAGHENVKVVNAGVSGDTSSGGLARLDWAVGPEADAVILELGANDALRAIDPALTRKNLTEIVAQLKERNLPILLAGMYAPPNLGSEYGEAFNSIYPDLAEEEGLILYPFFLDGVAGNRALNLADGIHPTAEGVGIIVERILPSVEDLIAEAETREAASN